MKKLILTIFLLIIFQRDGVFAQEKVATQSQAISSNEVNYELPYPGILPDHQLYFLKILRDRIVGALINDPYKKAEFDLLTSDKRLNASAFLIESNKKEDELAISTISKSNNYVDDAIANIIRAKKENKDINPFLLTISLSLKKHQQVLKKLEKEVDQNYRKALAAEYQRLKNSEKTVSILMPQKQ